jgi:hypothetical protein
VFADRNGNGVCDRGEKGLRNISISNGDTIIFTTRGGYFTIDAGGESVLFPIMPSGYASTGNKIVNIALRGVQSEEGLCFPLVKQRQKETFRVAAVGDVQANDTTELSYAARTIFSELSDRRDIDFAIYLGDLVNDEVALLPAAVQQLERMPHTSWTTLGNHDLDKKRGAPRLPDSYKQIFGPSDYAFNYGKTLFIVLDNVSDYESGEFEGLGARQKRFVRNCLAITPADYNVVVCVHIPIAESKRHSEVTALFEGRSRVLILSGHTHMTSRHILAPNVCELVAGASCGSWWTGERGPDAVPLAIQRCGAPRNYYTLDFSDKGYSFAFKGVGLDPAVGMDVWIKGEEPLDNEIEALSELPDGSVVANIYGGAEVTKVVMRVDGGPWQAMEYSPMQAPAVSRIIYWNRTAGFPTKYSRRTPLPRGSTSPHVWRLQLPETLSAGSHTVEIHAHDDYGFETSLTREFIKR